jgi:ribonuclease-3
MNTLDPDPLASLPQELTVLNQDLLQRALTHRSFRARQISHEETNERLEFLGDAVLELIVTQYLFQEHPHWDEGRLTRYRAAIVRTETLAYAAEQIHLGEHLRLNVVEEERPDTIQLSLLADVFEAVLGALYLEKGFSACEAFVQKYLLPHQAQFVQYDAKDPKSLLQEKLQAEGNTPPEYVVVGEEGPDHAKIFTIEARFPDKDPVQGQGNSKQRAEQSAAEAALLRYFPGK